MGIWSPKRRTGVGHRTNSGAIDALQPRDDERTVATSVQFFQLIIVEIIVVQFFQLIIILLLIKFIILVQFVVDKFLLKFLEQFVIERQQ